MPSRRHFLAGVAAAGAAPAFSWAAVGNPDVLSAARMPDGTYVLVGLTRTGDIAFQIPLPARGHAAAAHPHFAEAVAIARRPGTFAKVIDCATGNVSQTLTAPEGRHFYGHGAFSADGTLLFTPENDIATGTGRVGVWDRSLGYLRIDEVPSGGIGPHEILRLPSGDLAVANGGIRTHPESGREKLNLDTMRANLTILSPSGQLRDQAEVPAHQRHNSLRHIAASPDGTVICGFQWQGDPYDAPPLVSFYKGAGQLRPARMDEGDLRVLDGYIGSVCTMGAAGFAASSPRGGRVLTFDAQGTQTGSHRAMDACGLAQAGPTTCLATDGLGGFFNVTASEMRKKTAHALAFDNHLVSLG